MCPKRVYTDGRVTDVRCGGRGGAGILDIGSIKSDTAHAFKRSCKLHRATRRIPFRTVVVSSEMRERRPRLAPSPATRMAIRTTWHLPLHRFLIAARGSTNRADRLRPQRTRSNGFTRPAHDEPPAPARHRGPAGGGGGTVRTWGTWPARPRVWGGTRTGNSEKEHAHHMSNSFIRVNQLGPVAAGGGRLASLYFAFGFAPKPP